MSSNNYDIKNKLIDPFSGIHLRVHKSPIVYFLFDGDTLVYVGKSVRGLERVYEHKDKMFTHVKIQYCDREYLDELEQAYIAIHRPKYNLVEPKYKCKWSYAAMTHPDYHKLDPISSVKPRLQSRPAFDDDHYVRLAMHKSSLQDFSDGLGI